MTPELIETIVTMILAALVILGLLIVGIRYYIKEQNLTIELKKELLEFLKNHNNK